MKKSTDKKYGYLNNLCFIIKNQWNFRKMYMVSLAVVTPIRVVSSLVAAFLPKIVLDCIESNVPPEEMIFKVGLGVVLLVAVNVFSLVAENYDSKEFFLSRVSLYRMKLFNKIIDMDYNNYVFNSTRVLKEKGNQSIEGYGTSITFFLYVSSLLISGLFGFTSFTAIIAQCNIWFIPVLIVCYALSALGWMLLQRYNDSMKDARSKVFMRLGYVTFRSKDFANAKDLRVYNMTDFLMRKINRHLKENTDFDIKKNNGHYINVVFEDILKFGVSLGAYLYLIQLKLNSDMTLGDFSLYFGAITGFGAWLNQIVDSLSTLIECDHKVNDYRNFLALKDKMNKGEGVPLPKDGDLPCSVDIENLTFAYDGADEPTIKNVSLSIKAGEKIAIVGVNGAGKSTLVKLISGLFLPQEGKIKINGTDSTLFNRDEYYTLFSAIFQDVSLLPASIAKNIALCEEEKIDRDRLFECMRLAGIDEKINSLENKENTLLVKEINEGATALSGGELQRLLLARAIYKDSPIIILDEPTAALDPIAENNIYLMYNELTKGKTSIYISHRLSSTRFCDRIVLLDNSEIAEIGTHEELMALGGKYTEMFKTQSKYYREEVEL